MSLFALPAFNRKSLPDVELKLVSVVTEPAATVLPDVSTENLVALPLFSCHLVSLPSTPANHLALPPCL